MMTNEEKWIPFLENWDENGNPFEEVRPTINTGEMKEVRNMSVRQVDIVTGYFYGFNHIITSVVALAKW